jgi:hypothetical protein
MFGFITCPWIMGFTQLIILDLEDSGDTLCDLLYFPIFILGVVCLQREIRSALSAFFPPRSTDSLPDMQTVFQPRNPPTSETNFKPFEILNQFWKAFHHVISMTLIKYCNL